MSVKVKNELTIDGVVVDLKHENSTLKVYSTKDLETIYISLPNGDVVSKIDIHTDMSQGQGFVDKLVFVDFKDD